jgi:hypothetical protein
LIGYFEGLDAERAIAWRAADSFALREFLGLVLPEAPPDHSTISRTRRLIETHEAVFTWMLQRVAEAGPGEGTTVGIDATTTMLIVLNSTGMRNAEPAQPASEGHQQSIDADSHPARQRWSQSFRSGQRIRSPPAPRIDAQCAGDARGIAASSIPPSDAP